MIRTLAIAATALVASGSVAMAADLYIPETPVVYEDVSGSNWEGAYVGGRVIGYFEEGNDPQLALGASIGYNFVPVDPLLLGIELQGNYFFENDDFDAAGEISLMGRAGVIVSDSVVVYALGGVGHVWEDDGNDFSNYKLGAGIELAVAEDMSIRGDLVGVGYDDTGFEAAEASVGRFFHF